MPGWDVGGVGEQFEHVIAGPAEKLLQGELQRRSAGPGQARPDHAQRHGDHLRSCWLTGAGFPRWESGLAGEQLQALVLRCGRARLSVPFMKINNHGTIRQGP
jgi:hypothetical protein